MDPPHLLSISNAISLLKAIDCLSSDEQLTAVGSLVSQLPLNPRMGRMLLFGCLFGCAPSMLMAAAAMGYRDPFVLPVSEAQRAQCTRVKNQFANGSQSDQLAVLSAIAEFTRLLSWQMNTNTNRSNGGYPPHVFRFCEERFLSFSTMIYLHELAQQLRNIMREAQLNLAHASHLRNDGSRALVLSCISLGLYPNVAVRRRGAKIFVTEKACRARIHSSSVNGSAPRYRNECVRESLEAVGYQDLIASSGPNFVKGKSVIGGANYSMMSTMPVSMLAILLFCGQVELLRTIDSGDAGGKSGGGGDFKATGAVQEGAVVLLVDQWLALRMRPHEAQLLQQARTALQISLNQFLQNPQRALPKEVALAVHQLTEALSISQTTA